MRKIRHYEGDCFEFHKKVVERKESDVLKKHITTINDDIKVQYNNYDTAFGKDTLRSLVPLNLTKETKDELKSLYSYDAYIFRKLKRILTVDKNNRLDNLCPNCTINTINSFDHYLPQSEFAEYVDNPINLIPSCTECNGHKSSVWKKDGKRLFLNLYLDDLPSVQYLFIELSIADDGKSINTVFNVENREGKIDANLFEKISYHYEKLDLCNRFCGNSEKVLSSLANYIYQLKDLLTDDAIKAVIMSNVHNERLKYGFNFWEAILKESVCNNTAIFDFFKNKPY